MSLSGADSRKPTAATVGTFDGLHKGHRKVLRLLKETASRRGLLPLVVTFDRHPLETVAPRRAPGLLLNPSEKLTELRNEGFRPNIVEFTEQMAAVTARDWMKRLRDDFGVKVMVVGYDNTFGSDGVGMSIADYQMLGCELGIEVLEAPVEKDVSSSAIRRLISEGRMEEANGMLGRNFQISGTVTHGKALGRTLGFPTANIVPSYRAQMPRRGVYAADALLPDGTVGRAVVNVGTAPTLDDSSDITVEAYLLDYDGDLYDKRITLKFKKFIRDEKRFPNLDALRLQIQDDVLAVKNLT